MKIDSKSPYKYKNIFVLVIYLFAIIAFFILKKIQSKIELTNLLIIFGCATIFVLYVFIKIEMFHFRTIEFDENGCTVTFLFLKKKYAWEKLKIKWLEKYESQYSFDRIYNGTRVAVFSPHKFLKPKSLLPVAYFMIPFINPFNYIFINLTGNDNDPVPKGFYEYDESEFMQKMKEWNVEFEERTIPKGWKPPAL